MSSCYRCGSVDHEYMACPFIVCSSCRRMVREDSHNCDSATLAQIIAKNMREEIDRIARENLNKDYAKRVEENFVPRRLTYNQTNTTVPVYSMTSMSNAYIPANATIDTFIHVKKESNMNVRATALPTVGGHRAVVVRQGRVETFDGVGDEVLWESAKVYKTYDKAKAAAERRIADGLKAVFG